MKEIAILGPTASGKTALSLELADICNAVILSLDSLSIYKEIDIASAKPTKQERGNIPHFGIDEIYINEHFSVTLFFDIYKFSKSKAKRENKNLIIVGGTSFYLKSLIDGLHPKPQISQDIKNKIKQIPIKEAFEIVKSNDPIYAEKISSNDKYRIEKWLEIFFATNKPLTTYFNSLHKSPLAKDLKIYEIELDRNELKNKIALRTNKMIQQGLIDEVLYLEKKYTRIPKAMSAIGIKETLEYLDGYLNLEELQTKITNKTAQLAKRQSTFNKSQFKDIIKSDTKTLKTLISTYLNS